MEGTANMRRNLALGTAAFLLSLLTLAATVSAVVFFEEAACTEGEDFLCDPQGWHWGAAFASLGVVFVVGIPAALLWMAFVRSLRSDRDSRA
jgi:hypothetical protein